MNGRSRMLVAQMRWYIVSRSGVGSTAMGSAGGGCGARKAALRTSRLTMGGAPLVGLEVGKVLLWVVVTGERGRERGERVFDQSQRVIIDDLPGHSE